MPNNLGRGRKRGYPRRWGVWMPKREEKGRKREGVGNSYGACGLLVMMLRDLRRGLFK